MKILLAILLTAAYVVTGARAFYVSQEMENRIGRNCTACSLLTGALWPGNILVMGMGITMAGDAGVYDSAYRHKQQ